jgi:TPP-dependent pyruvate/acetoin dehydrogenase alpha subunit
VHLCTGQEATPVGTAAALGPADAVFATYRGHGWAIACGAPLEMMFAELLGRESGLNQGRGGSAYLSAPDWRFFGENSIVGGGAPIACGAALAISMNGGQQVVICVFGDGAMNQGSVHEALNLAVVMRLPLIFICENNGYSELTPTRTMVGNDHFHERAAVYGMHSERIDGNDVDAVRCAVAARIAHAREGGGPSFIEAMTSRLGGHYIGDAETYRSVDEMDAAWKKDPLLLLRDQLHRAGQDESRLQEVEASVRNSIDVACAAALAAPLADASRVRECLYA